MAGLDLAGLKTFDKEQAAKQGDGDLFARAGKVLNEDGTDIKICEPNPNLAGKYFIEVIQWWINKKPYISPETFGEPCPIQAEVDAAQEQAKTDKDLRALLDNDQVFSKKSAFWIPIFLLDVKLGAGNKIESWTIVDGKAKVLDAGPQLMKAINQVVLGRAAQNDTDEGITHRKLGRSIICTKTGKLLDTKYAAQLGDVFEIEDAYYKHIPDVLKLASEAIYPNEYLASVAGNYLYGEALLPEPERKKSSSTEATAETAATTSRRAGAAPVEAKAADGIEDAVVIEETTNAPATRRGQQAAAAETTAAPAGGSKRSVLNALTNLD